MSASRTWTLAVLACGGVEQGYSPVPALDRATFAASVEPVLEARCANPSCHGRPERALALYAPHRRRADPSRLFLDEPLTPGELGANYDRACAFASGIEDPDDCLLLRKPEGRGYHGGGTVFGAFDPEAESIRAWLETAQ